MVISLLDDLFKQGLLKKAARSKELAGKSLEQAAYFLREAQDLTALKKERMAVIALYSAMFHCARALLYRDGIKEKSHYAVARYLEYEYVEKGIIDRKYVLVLDILRDYRHESLYSLFTADVDTDLKEYIESCRQFTGIVKAIIK
jgi:uncharacterized protein (UPF0332 family)